jgi:hypothetical protein
MNIEGRNVIRFPQIASACLPIQQLVPKDVRSLSAEELSCLSPLQKALVGIIFTMRNLDRNAINLREAEKEVAATFSSLEKIYFTRDHS